jgi:hypothetical protein
MVIHHDVRIEVGKCNAVSEKQQLLFQAQSSYRRTIYHIEAGANLTRPVTDAARLPSLVFDFLRDLFIQCAFYIGNLSSQDSSDIAAQRERGLEILCPTI